MELLQTSTWLPSSISNEAQVPFWRVSRLQTDLWLDPWQMQTFVSSALSLFGVGHYGFGSRQTAWRSVGQKDHSQGEKGLSLSRLSGMELFLFVGSIPEIKMLKVPMPVVCLGGHEKTNWPCFKATPTSCGRQCGRSLKCGNHKCPILCHTVKNSLDNNMVNSDCNKNYKQLNLVNCFLYRLARTAPRVSCRASFPDRKAVTTLVCCLATLHRASLVLKEWNWSATAAWTNFTHRATNGRWSTAEMPRRRSRNCSAAETSALRTTAAATDAKPSVTRVNVLSQKRAGRKSKSSALASACGRISLAMLCEPEMQL